MDIDFLQEGLRREKNPSDLRKELLENCRYTILSAHTRIKTVHVLLVRVERLRLGINVFRSLKL